MEKSFAKLLRTSKLASFDSAIPQVYSTKNCWKKRGDWGLKRSLPTVIRTKLITVGALDTAEHQTPWDSANSSVNFVRVWKENFPNSTAPKPQPEVVLKDLGSMTEEQFKLLLKKSGKRSEEYIQLVKDEKLSKNQLLEYLGVTASPTAQRSQSIVGPTYSDHQVEYGYPVEGRIVNMDGAMKYVVGVSGITATLPVKNTGRPPIDKEVRTFYVNHASIEADGSPNVTLSSVKPGEEPIYINKDEKDYLGYSESDEGGEVALQDMFKTTPSPNAKQSAKANNMRAADSLSAKTPLGKTHPLLMSRILTLMQKSQPKDEEPEMPSNKKK
ncbi:hypothetical protein K450DRAFT_218302 [Umbelopsis ramanniana AG]|uniref:Uncharacterized protein n=1 Tax=Umbelopsis ramanniana AG TaxID=1314678 RepID=A0AAD5HIX4_UMBRA|nr:uncharacterized protein K450DRAFT_218302 [Umbelopsis ramanniana AG]KAI8584131.1 hypothetical protein K450DRAFT_218302 [Umbelopsis ramanniana AG]